MSTRPVVAAEPREVVGKKVSVLRRQGILPAVVYGSGAGSKPIQMDARQFDVLRRTVSRNAIVDLKVGTRKATPVLLQGIHEHPVRRHAMHVDFLIVSMTEELTVDVPVNYMGDSSAADKLGGTVLHLRETVQIRALPTDLPSAIDLDISPLDSFESVLHVSDLVVPAAVAILSDPEEALARVQPPRVEEEPVIAEDEVAEGEELEEGAEVGEDEDEGSTEGSAEEG